MLCWPRLCPGAGLGAAATGAGAGTAACDRGRRAAVWDVGTDCGMFVLGGGVVILSSCPFWKGLTPLKLLPY